MFTLLPRPCHSGWRSPSKATEDRNFPRRINTPSAIKVAAVFRGHRGSQHRVGLGRARIDQVRQSSFAAAEDRNALAQE